MKLEKLPKTTSPSKKRVGRGYGSGKGGHTATRGTKGQLSRSKVHAWFEGGQLPLVKRLPFQRGKGRFKPFTKKPLIVNLKYLNLLPKGSQVTAASLVKYGIISAASAKKSQVKILGDGKLEKPLKISLPTSKAAAKAIKKAGGSIIEVKNKAASPKKKVKKAPASKTKTKPATIKKSKTKLKSK